MGILQPHKMYSLDMPVVDFSIAGYIIEVRIL
jgi:hypothetical protein